MFGKMFGKNKKIKQLERTIKELREEVEYVESINVGLFKENIEYQLDAIKFDKESIKYKALLLKFKPLLTEWYKELEKELSKLKKTNIKNLNHAEELVDEIEEINSLSKSLKPFVEE